MGDHRKKLGRFGEDLACRFLLQHGYTIIHRNFSSRYGELDIVAMHPRDPATLSCIEVKTRTTEDFGVPEDAITPAKIKKLRDTACSYFFQNKIEGNYFRLDVIAITLNTRTKRARIKHLKGIGDGSKFSQ